MAADYRPVSADAEVRTGAGQMPWSCCCRRAHRGPVPDMPKCRDAEERLLRIVPADVLRHDTTVQVPGFDGKVSIHSLEIAGEMGVTDVPLVLLPGYCTGAAFFAKALAYFKSDQLQPHASVLAKKHYMAVDPLGCYLSSRPPWSAGTEPGAAEAWFVESLEAWRSQRGLEVMDLLGHSIGGNIAASYAERYPARVRTLVLLSPAGVPKEPEDYRKKLPTAPWRMRCALNLWGQGWVPHHLGRWIPASRGMRVANWNAQRWTRLSKGGPQFDTEALADYMYWGCLEGPASGEMALPALLHPGAWGKRPLCERLPKLRVSRLELIYGEVDWMDVRHGNQMAETCRSASEAAASPRGPAIGVQLVSGAGHYAHLENVVDFAAALAQALEEPQKVEDAQKVRLAEVPANFGDRFKGDSVPAWRSWEGYEFGR
eukprot:TRINITY_DN44538_c0_g1_i1.p1 TRINITY_DN44538_c0_g1~~TRINITY_DN44538_c0_g1_i1.p1  ORF type:complete len:429 (-),score=70.96 TRINITY_DN44538_c0_g1_i1:85-1371(-)